MTGTDTTPLHGLHLELGAKMIAFAGYDMPVQYRAGVMQEHLHTRAAVGLFDVSHMGQVRLSGPSWEMVAGAFETLVPMDVRGLADGRQRYGFFTNDAGGIEDDLMFARAGDDLMVVVNAACKAADIAHMRASLPGKISVEELSDRALVALQGPRAQAVMAGLDARAAQMRFMDVAELEPGGIAVVASRSGYTGEDGYEISVPAPEAERLARLLLAHEDVLPVGLGARDSLRLEAGLCLYGHDIDATTDPVSAALTWAIQKVRRPGGDRAGGFPGADVIFERMEQEAGLRRVGLRPKGRAPMREGVQIFDSAQGGDPLGHVTSGGFGPTVGAPVAMGYVPHALSEAGTGLWGEVRGKRLPVTVAALPFVPANFKR